MRGSDRTLPVAVPIHRLPPRTLGTARSASHVGIAPRNLVNLKSVAKGYGSHSVLDDVTLGLNAGERIGVVGENGAGKSTLVRLIAGHEEPDEGAVTRTGGIAPVLVSQRDELSPEDTVRDALVGDPGRPRVGRGRGVSQRAGRAAGRRRRHRLHRRP